MGGVPGRMLRAPWQSRTAREVLFCLAGVVFGLVVLVMVTPIGVLALLTFLLLAPRVGRAAGAPNRLLAARLLDAPIPEPPPRRRGRGGLIGDGPGWRGAAYCLLKLPLAIPQGYAVLCYLGGLANLTYPLWWPLFRNHPQGTVLSPVPAVTPFGAFDVATYPQTLLAAAAGFAMLLAAPWVARGATRLDLAAMRALLGPGRHAQQLRHLRDMRARAVDDAAAMVRRLERDLHDGAQVRLATLALNLGMASEKLGGAGPPPDLDQARELVAVAHRGAKDALAELRSLVRGMHPPVLDNGLPDALATLASDSPVPVALHADLPQRPSPAIETIAYFSVAELLANAAKHSRASRITVELVTSPRVLSIRVSDDGVGGADPARGSGLAGLADRLGTVDGWIDVVSPPGGPTRVAVELPLQA
jgi:signal transduction histidine kinase